LGNRVAMPWSLAVLGAQASFHIQEI